MRRRIEGGRKVYYMGDEPFLRHDPEGLTLVAGGMELRCDFTRMLQRVVPGRLGRELLVRAAKVHGVGAPRAVDATAGLGEDSFLLAAAGFEVTLCERDQTLAALLRDGLTRAAANPQLAPIVQRMTLVEGDSLAVLRSLAAPPDVVYLDPMFPARRKSAQVGKKAQLLQALERPCDNEGEMLSTSLAAGPRKVVVKRPPKGPRLAGAKPAYALAGKSVRYDVYLPASMRADARA